jgi:basic membrane protein A
VSALYDWEFDLLESQEMAGYQPNLTRSLQSDCELIVALMGADFPELLMAAAEAYPDQKIFTHDLPTASPPGNVWTQLYASDQAAFLAGYVAAAVTRTGKVATFGGVQHPLVTVFMDGFALGVDHYNKKNGTRVEVLGWDVEKRTGSFTDNFENLDDGRRMGERLIDQGADVILPVAGLLGWGTAEAVKERGNALIIGVDYDWAASNPAYADYILTSIMKRIDVSVASAIRAVVEGTFTGGVHIGTLENGDVGLASFYGLDGLISAQVKAELEQIKADIIAGKIKTRPLDVYP